MSKNQNRSLESIKSRPKSRSQSIPKPPSLPPPPIPVSSSISEITTKIHGSEIDGERLRAASESKISAKSAISAKSNVTDDNLVSKRSVSFSRTRNPRSRTTTGKSILKKPKNDISNHSDQTQEAQHGTNDL